MFCIMFCKIFCIFWIFCYTLWILFCIFCTLYYIICILFCILFGVLLFQLGQHQGCSSIIVTHYGREPFSTRQSLSSVNEILASTIQLVLLLKLIQSHCAWRHNQQITCTFTKCTICPICPICRIYVKYVKYAEYATLPPPNLRLPGCPSWNHIYPHANQAYTMPQTCLVASCPHSRAYTRATPALPSPKGAFILPPRDP